MPKRSLDELTRAVLNLHQIIEVRPIPEEERRMLRIKDLERCSSVTKFDHAVVFEVASNKVRYLKLDDLSSSNFFIVLELNGSECGKPSTDVLAGAKPCFHDTQKNNRPSMSRLVVCLNNPDWRRFRSGYDLFRHEILHALGFGSLYPQSEDKKAPTSRTRVWRTGASSQQVISEHYLDFGKEAIQFARNHFNCLKMDGILSDDQKRFHLNEYLFGASFFHPSKSMPIQNELMTPILPNGRSYFTHLTASILENTHFGNISWYKVNRTLIEKESRAYWYGRNAGCDFVLKSCYDFIRSRSRRQFDGSAFPFCTQSDIMKTLRRQELNICFSNNTHIVKFKATCQIEHEEYYPEDYEMTPVTLNHQYSSTHQFRNLYGSDKEYRYCPMIAQLFDGTFDSIPEDSRPVKCSN